MIQVSERQGALLEELRDSVLRTSEMGKMFGKLQVANDIKRLTQYGLIVKVRHGAYTAVDPLPEYEVSGKMASLSKEKTTWPIEPPSVKGQVDKGTVDYLRRNYCKKKRREMAKELGISKYELNKILLKTGIGS